MTQLRINPSTCRAAQRGFTLVELLVGLLLVVLLVSVASTFYNLIKGNNVYGLSGQVLQDGANIVLSKIIQGGTEATGVERLTQSVAYCIGSGSPVCSIVNPSEIHYWDMNGVERSYRLNNSLNQLIYHHPTTLVPAGTDEVIYTAPDQSIITLTFWVPTSGNYTAADVNFSVSLSKNIFGKTVTGSATTQVNLRNHP